MLQCLCTCGNVVFVLNRTICTSIITAGTDGAEPLSRLGSNHEREKRSAAKGVEHDKRLRCWWGLTKHHFFIGLGKTTHSVDGGVT